MIASTASCKATQSHRRKHLSASRRITKANQRCLRQPLANKAVNDVQQQLHLAAATATLQLPRHLARPLACDVDRKHIESTYPELAQVPTEYIRSGLSITGPDMLAAVANVRRVTRVQPSTSSLPRALEIVMDDIVAAACPTHILAICSGASPSRKRKVTLFPTHHLTLAAHCANLPHLPTSMPNTAGATVTLPVVPLSLPSPETFNVLQSYLYTKRLDTLFASLLPTPPSFNDDSISLPEMVSSLTQHLSATCSSLSLARHAMLINSLWQNACALGVQDDQLWGAIEITWQAVVGAMEAVQGQC